MYEHRIIVTLVAQFVYYRATRTAEKSATVKVAARHGLRMRIYFRKRECSIMVYRKKVNQLHIVISNWDVNLSAHRLL